MFGAYNDYCNVQPEDQTINQNEYVMSVKAGKLF